MRTLTTGILALLASGVVSCVGSNPSWQNPVDPARDSSATTSTPTPPGSPSTFAKLAPSAGATEQEPTLTLRWNASDGATTYDWCVLPASVQCSQWTDIGNVTSKQISGLTGNTLYQWQIR